MSCIQTHRQGDDGSGGGVGPGGVVGGKLHETISHTCLSSSAEYELALILKELRWITDQVSKFKYSNTTTLYDYICVYNKLILC